MIGRRIRSYERGNASSRTSRRRPSLGTLHTPRRGGICDQEEEPKGRMQSETVRCSRDRTKDLKFGQGKGDKQTHLNSATPGREQSKSHALMECAAAEMDQKYV